MFVQSDANLRQYSLNFNKTSTQISNAKIYLETLLTTQVDLNGDGNITTTEMLQALSYRSISNIPTMNLWCRSSVPGSTCYTTTPNVVETAAMFNDMVNNFLTSSQHTFDGSGNLLVSSMTSTFPNTSWSDSQCQQNNLIFNSNARVLSSWNLATTFPVSRVCGYVNANLSSAFVSSTYILSGTQTFFSDVYIGMRQNYKRIYCISVDYITGCTSGGTLIGKTCSSGSAVISTAYSCSVGLFYVSYKAAQHHDI